MAAAELIFPVHCLDAVETDSAPLVEVALTNNTRLSVAFDDAVGTLKYRNGKFTVPSDIDGSGTVTFRAWVAAATADSAKEFRLAVDLLPLGDSDGMDTAYSGTEDSGDVACDTTQDDLMLVEWTETVTNLGWSANDMVMFRISRIGILSGTELVGDLYWDLFSIEIPLT